MIFIVKTIFVFLYILFAILGRQTLQIVIHIAFLIINVYKKEMTHSREVINMYNFTYKEIRDIF